MWNEHTNNMTPVEQLLAWLDGELSADAEGAVFRFLAENPVLRQEFRAMLAIGEQMRAPLAQAPEFCKQAVMRTVGLHLPAASGSGKVAGWIKNKSLILGFPLTALLSALLTASLFLLAGAEADPPQPVVILADTARHIQPDKEPAAGNRVYVQNADSSPRYIAPATTLAPKPTETDGNGELHATVQTFGTPVRPASKHDAVRTDRSPVRQSAIRESIVLGGGNAMATQSVQEAEQAERIPATETETQKFNNADNSANLRFSFGMRTFRAASFPDVDLGPLVEPELNNIAFSLLYRLDGHHSLGFELGQEEFLQEYRAVQNGVQVAIKQNYLGLWYGVCYEYRLPVVSALLEARPVARVLVGGNRMGPLGRIMAGVEVPLSSRLKLHCGIEGSVLLYNYQQQWYSSRKLGAGIGFHIDF